MKETQKMLNVEEQKSGSKANVEPDKKESALNLNSPGIAIAAAKRIKEDIDEYCVRTYDGGHRKHLGASLIGDECSRKLWYIFRWCFLEKTDGRRQRLFNRGHREEARFIEWLEGIGVKVWYENREGLMYHPESDSYIIAKPGEELDPLCVPIIETDPNYMMHVGRAKLQGIEFPQYRVSAVNGHFGGSLDGIGILPERFNIPTPVLLEFKTNGTGRAFENLLSDGMAVSKPQHFAQTSTYGSDPNYSFSHVLYLNINKNDDSLHVELCKLDFKLGNEMRLKAERIITSQEAPPRLSDNPTYIKCGRCGAKDICHKGAIPEKNCRSCSHAMPAENEAWFCEVFSGVIPEDFISKGCDEHYHPITATAKND